MKNISILFNIIILFTGAIVRGQSITGKLMNSRQQAISYAEITVSRDKVNLTVISNEAGAFSINLPQNGDYKLSVKKDKELIYEKTVKVSNDINQDITIDIKETQIQGVTISG